MVHRSNYSTSAQPRLRIKLTDMFYISQKLYRNLPELIKEAESDSVNVNDKKVISGFTILPGKLQRH